MAKKKWLLLIIMIASISAHAQYTAIHNISAVAQTEFEFGQTNPTYWAGLNLSNTLDWGNGFILDCGGTYGVSSKCEVKGTFDIMAGYKPVEWFSIMAGLKNGVSTKSDSISFYSTSNKDRYYEYRKSPYYLASVNVLLNFIIKNSLTIGLEAGLNHYTPIGSVAKNLGDNWVLENSSIAHKNSVLIGLNVGYSIPNTVKKDGDNPFEIFAEAGWNTMFGAKAGIATGYTWRVAYFAMLEASTGVDYYWQSQSLAANLRFGTRFTPWGNYSKAIFALHGQIAVGEYYGFKYDIFAENPDRFSAGGLNNTLGCNVSAAPEFELNLYKAGIGLRLGCRFGCFLCPDFDAENANVNVYKNNPFNMEAYFIIRYNNP